mgnify:FL=1
MEGLFIRSEVLRKREWKMIRAFTLMEMLVVLVISGLIIGFGYSGYRYLLTTFHEFRVSNNLGIAAHEAMSVLEFDCAKSSHIICLGERSVGLIVEGRTIEWEILKSSIVRRDQGTDTFSISNPQFLVLFDNIPVYGEGIGDKLEIKFSLGDGMECRKLICKRYSISDLITKNEFFQNERN